MRIELPTAILCFFLLGSVSVDAEVAGLPDNHSVRRQLADVITAPTDEVLAMPSAVYHDIGQGLAVKFSVRTQQGDFYLLFTDERNGRFPLDSRGSYIIRRREHDGSFVQVKIFLNGDPQSFVRIFPMGERSTMDLYLYGYQMYNGVTIPLQFRRILTDPFSKIMALTTATVDWPLVLPVRPLPEDRIVETMVNDIRERLPLLKDHSDGAMGSNGEFVHIKNLQTLNHGGFNCCGFAKWVVDGLYRPRTGHLISVEALKQKHLDQRGNPWSSRYEQERDPYFGLDWTRNLAFSLTHLDNPSAGPRSDDVTNVPSFQYVDNVGYSVAQLKIILYELAVENPGYFYLGAVNREYGTNPMLREFTHVVVLFPYFDSRGVFQIAVMERNLESGLASLERRYSADYIHLVRVRASTDFAPPMH